MVSLGTNRNGFINLNVKVDPDMAYFRKKAVSASVIIQLMILFTVLVLFIIIVL